MNRTTLLPRDIEIYSLGALGNHIDADCPDKRTLRPKSLHAILFYIHEDLYLSVNYRYLFGGKFGTNRQYLEDFRRKFALFVPQFNFPFCVPVKIIYKKSPG